MSQENIVRVLAPCYNEGAGIKLFLDDLAKTISDQNINTEIEIFLIDDGSTDDTLEMALSWKSPLSTIKLRVFPLVRNVGHQGAIYSGLIILSRETIQTSVIVMDSDGEDDPNVFKELIANNGKYDILFVNRGKRSENLLFRVFYQIYRLMFKIVTGRKIDFGNYCMLSPKMVNEIASDNFFLHLAATLSKKKVKKSNIVADRRKRLDGNSKMGFMGLVNHGFNSLIVYAEELVLWFLKFSITMIIVFFGSISYIVYEKLFTSKAIPGWASTLSLGFFNAALISLGFFIIGLLMLKVRFLQDGPTVAPDLQAATPSSPGEKTTGTEKAESGVS